MTGWLALYSGDPHHVIKCPYCEHIAQGTVHVGHRTMCGICNESFVLAREHTAPLRVIEIHF